MTNNPHVMSMYATELDCLRDRDKWFQEKHKQLVEVALQMRDALVLHAKEFPASPNFATAVKALAAFERFEKGVE